MVRLCGDEPGTMTKFGRVDIKLEGARELDRKLRELPRKLQRKVIRQALRAGMRPIHEAAKQNAPVATGLLKQSIKLRAMKRNRRGVIGVKIETEGGNFKGETFYGAFQEFGYRRGKRSLGNNRKFIPGKHYMQRAAEDKKEQAVAIVSEHMAAGIVQAAKV